MMASRLLPLPLRFYLLVRARRAGLFVLAVIVAALFALELALGDPSGSLARNIGTAAIPLLLASDCLGLARGTAVLWAQKPVDPVRLYLAAHAECAVVSIALVVVLNGTIIAGALLLGWTPTDDPLRVAGAYSLLTMVVSAVAVGLSVWMPRTGSWVAVLLLIPALGLEIVVTLDSQLAGQPWIPLARVVLIPWGAIAELASPQEAVAELGLLLHIVAYAVAWVVVGAFGIRRAVARLGSLGSS